MSSVMIKGSDNKGDSKHMDMSQIVENIEKQGFTPRGAGWIEGADQYYWFSQIVAGDSSYFFAPEKVATDPNAFWLSGLMRWMIPLDGKPSPHAIIMGQWEPTDVEANKGIKPGMGAVSALLFGEDQCGQRGLPIAKKRAEIYTSILALLKGTDDSEALDASGKGWEAAKTVLPSEASDCENVTKGPFPSDGDYSDFPQFATPEVKGVEDWGKGTDLKSSSCFVIKERTDFIVWQKDAFQKCILANDEVTKSRR